MSKRRLTATNVGEGKGRSQDSVHYISKRFCCECHAHGNRPHYDGCTTVDWKQIPTWAQVPKRSASNRIWKLFIKKFVEGVYIKEYYKKVKEDRAKTYTTYKPNHKRSIKKSTKSFRKRN